MTGNDAAFSGWIPPRFISPPHDKKCTDLCEWKNEGDCWTGSCGIAWCFNNDDGPEGNKMKYCPKCGKLLKEV